MWIKIRIEVSNDALTFAHGDSNVYGTMVALDRCFVLVIGLSCNERVKSIDNALRCSESIEIVVIRI